MSDTADTSLRSSSSDDDEQEEEAKSHHTESSDDNTVEGVDVSLLLDIKKLSLSNKKRESKKKLLIFNINGLLLHRIHIKYTVKTPKTRRPDAVFGNKLGMSTLISLLFLLSMVTLFLMPGFCYDSF